MAYLVDFNNTWPRRWRLKKTQLKNVKILTPACPHPSTLGENLLNMCIYLLTRPDTFAVKKFIDNQFQKTSVVIITWNLSRVFRYLIFWYETRNQLKKCLFIKGLQVKILCYLAVKNYFRSSAKIFHSNLLRMLEFRVEIPSDCSFGLGMEARNTTKLRHRLRDIVVRYLVTAEIWSS